jgi:arsenic resistance protein ArsH
MTSFNHPPRILFLYGSLRERSYSRLVAEEAARIMQEFGAEVKFFDPRELRSTAVSLIPIPKCRNCAS